MTTTATATDLVRFRAAPFGGSPLAAAMRDGAAPAEWGGTAPRDASGWRARVAALRGARLAVPLEAFGGAALPPALRDRLEALGRGEGLVVTTGQQPGLFGGPAYTLTKALAAQALAAALERLLEVPVTPVFWAATDDADWREAATVGVVGPDGLERLALAGPPTEGVALADVALGECAAAWRGFRHACGSAADAPLLTLVERAYGHDATIGGAYVTLLRGLLEPLGMPVLDAAHPALRAAAHGPACTALRRASAIAEALAGREAAIRAAGFTPQVEQLDGLSLVFRTGADGVRARVPIAEAEATAANAATGTLGANVLLRPVVERALLPTLTYVAGPGELAYFAQVGAVAEAAGLEAPVAVPRVPMRWETPTLRAHREALDLDDATLADPHAAAATLARRALDPDVTDAVERLRATVSAQLAQVREALQRDEALLPPAVIDGVARDVGHRLDRLERRILAAEKRRGDAWRRTLSLAQAELAPDGRPPERVLSLLPVLVRYGRDVLDGARAVAAAHAEALVGGSPASTP